ncbi:putative ABC transporter ATP-binding protein [Crateriforma conspicua]|uniref:Putative ABC transporter ATP-binding protein n=1 Tax=Crateriforma conspicua TaxID=2527996 RepID=A0A5C6FR24_9PLAN|nr:ABC transporter ATP-binding protein [Crateriforma conspicua]TWU63018.1 putative ABC transporter ATP-binding protein [Crateriforma conspicua]
MNRFSTLAAARSEPDAGGSLGTFFWSALAGVLVPAQVVLLGLIAQLLDNEGLSGTSVRLGSHLELPVPSWLVDQAPLRQLAELVVVSVFLAAIFCFAIWMNRRTADRRARSVVKSLHARLLRQSLRRAEFEGAAAQQVRAQTLIDQHLPNVQKGLSLWYRSIPRSVLILGTCVTLALLVNPWLALLAVLSGLMVWQLFRILREHDTDQLTDWELPRTRNRMAELVGQAPLLARLQADGLADTAFSSELETLYRRLAVEDEKRARLWPILFLASSVAIGVLILGLGVNLFGVQRGLSLPAGLVLGLALTGASVSSRRLSRLASQLRTSGRSSESVYLYLNRSGEMAPSEQRVGLGGLRDSVAIHDVSLNSSAGDAILSNLTLQLNPGSLVVLMGTDDVSSQALLELLMGFGRPSGGKVEIDGIPLLDVHPQALARNVMWVEPSGPIWEDTVLENLRGGDESINNSDIRDTLESLGIYEQLQRLPESLNTILTPGDRSLGQEVTYALGIARAVLHRPPIILAKESSPPAEHVADDPCLKALKNLADQGSLVVVLPRRLQTLRLADRVILLNGPRLVGEGTHTDLLNDSDLYRHLNYLLFNPYRRRRSTIATDA